MPDQIGNGALAIARATSSESNAARSPRAPPPRTTTTRSIACSAIRPSAATSCAGASAPWTSDGSRWIENAKPDRSSWPTRSRWASDPGLVTSPIRERDERNRQLTVPLEQALGLEREEQPAPCGGDPPEERLDVERGEPEAELAPAVPHRDLPAHPHHPADLELGSGLSELATDRRPLARPTDDLELLGSAAARRDLCAGVGKLEIPVAPRLAEPTDLTGHPYLVGELTCERPADALVEAGDRERALVRFDLFGAVGCGLLRIGIALDRLFDQVGHHGNRRASRPPPRNHRRGRGLRFGCEVLDRERGEILIGRRIDLDGPAGARLARGVHRLDPGDQLLRGLVATRWPEVLVGHDAEVESLFLSPGGHDRKGNGRWPHRSGGAGAMIASASRPGGRARRSGRPARQRDRGKV